LSEPKPSPRVGFILSHPFQYQFYASVAERLREPVFVLEHRKATPFEFSEEFVARLPGHVVRLMESELKVLDGLLDVIFCMTPKHVLVPFKKSKSVSLQYSFAKEAYQYGPWRCVADLNLMQGDYSHAKVNGFAASEIVGNPRYDGLEVSARGGGGVLYMPTYGELSSLPLFLKALPDLPRDMRIRIKTHHGSEFGDDALIEALRADDRVEMLDGYVNALPYIAEADLVVSDYSGATFDAIYLDRPIALIQHDLNQTILRTTPDSLEVSRAAEMGPIARSVEDIASVIRSALEQGDRWTESRRALKRELFAYEGCAADRVVAVLGDLLDGKYEKPLPQRLLSENYLRYIEGNRDLRKQLAASKKANKDLKKRVSTLKRRATTRGALRHVLTAPYRVAKRIYKSLKRRYSHA